MPATTAFRMYTNRGGRYWQERMLDFRHHRRIALPDPVNRKAERP